MDTLYLNLINAIDRYIEAHQLSANVNLLDLISSSDVFTASKVPVKCVSNHFLLEGLPDKAKNAKPDNDACHYCRLHISKNFSNFDNRHNQCRYCYEFLIDKYNKNEGELKLLKKNKFKKKNASLY